MTSLPLVMSELTIPPRSVKPLKSVRDLSGPKVAGPLQPPDIKRVPLFSFVWYNRINLGQPRPKLGPSSRLAERTIAVREMKNRGHAFGRINFKLILILVSVAVLLGGGAVVARYVRRKILAERDLAAGRAAYDRKDWATACDHFAEYLGRRPEDPEVLRKYAESLLAKEPFEQRSVSKAISCYRELVRLTPDDVEVYRKLASLYSCTGRLSDLSYLAKQWLQRDPKDVKAPIWLAVSLIHREKTEEARKVLLPFVERLKGLPEKHLDYIDACRMLGGIARQDPQGRGAVEEQEWLDRALAYDPNSAEGLIYRAFFYRGRPSIAGLSEQEMLEKARSDLERAETVATDDPRIALALSREWMHHGELDRAAGLLESVRDVAPAAVKEYFIGPDDWVIARFLQTVEVAVRRRKAAEVLPEAEKVLGLIEERSRRLAVLPSVVRLYLAAARPSEARKHLEEFLGLRKVLQVKGAEEQTAMLQAMVASSEGAGREVIRQLEPLSVGDRLGEGAMSLLANAYSQAGQPDKAIPILLKYLTKRPESGQMRTLLARQYLRQGRWSQAVETAKEAEKADPESLDANMIRIEAGIHAAAEQRPPAKAALEEIALALGELQKSHPTNARVRILRALVETASRRAGAAEQQLRQAIEDCSDTLELELMLSRVLAGQGRSEDALAVAQGACVGHGSSRQAWVALAQLHQAAGDLEQARAALERGLEAVAPPEKPDLARDLAVMELLQGERETRETGKASEKTQSGIKRLRDLATDDALDIRSRSLLLNLPEVARNGKLAERLLAEIRQAEGDRGFLWRQHRVRLWLADQRWRDHRDEMVRVLSEWMIQDPGWPFPALALAGLHQRLGQAREAEDVCRRALALNPDAVEVAEFLVAMLRRQDRQADAAKVLDGLEAPLPRTSPLRLSRPMAEGDLKESIENLTLRVAGNPRDVDARILLARMVYQRDQDTQRALQYLDEAAAIRPESTGVAWLKAVILKAEDRPAAAREVLDEFVKASETFGAYLLRASFLEQAGDFEAAEKDFVHLTTLKPPGEGRRLLASFYERRGKVGEMVGALERGLEIDKDDAALQIRLAHALMARRGKDDLSKAAKALSDAEKSLGENVAVLYAKASLMMAQGGADSRRRARAFLERLVEIEPSHIQGYFALIRLAEMSGRPDQAKVLIARGLQAAPNHTGLLLAQARAEMALKDPEAAAGLARNVLRQAPHNAEAIGMLAFIAIESKKPEALSEALKLARLAVSQRPQELGPLTAAVAILRAMGKPADAIAEMQAYAQQPAGQASIPVLTALAAAHRAEGNMEEWDAWVTKAEAASPGDPGVLLERLQGLAAQRKHDQIASRMAKYRQGGQFNPVVLAAAAQMLLASASDPCLQEAVKLCELALAAAPESESVPAQLRLGCAVFYAGDVGRAEALYRQVVETEPENGNALNGLAWTLATGRNDHAAALPFADKAVALSPEDGHFRHTRGVILAGLPGRKDEACVDFQASLKLAGPDNALRAEVLLDLGRARRDLSDPAGARKHLAEALRLDRQHDLLTAKQRSEIAEILKTLPAAP